MEPELLRTSKLTDVTAIIGQLKSLLLSPREEYVDAALMSMITIVKAFGSALKTTASPLQDSITLFKRQCQQLPSISAKSRELAKQIPA